MLTEINVRQGWWYHACPNCFKKFKITDNSFEFPNCKALKNPIPWFRIAATIEDDVEEATVIILGRTMENFLATSCKTLVSEQQAEDPKTLPPVLSQMVGQQYIFELTINQWKLDLGDPYASSPHSRVHANFNVLSIFKDDQTIQSSSGETATQTPMTPMFDAASATKSASQMMASPVSISSAKRSLLPSLSIDDSAKSSLTPEGKCDKQAGEKASSR